MVNTVSSPATIYRVEKETNAKIVLTQVIGTFPWLNGKSKQFLAGEGTLSPTAPPIQASVRGFLLKTQYLNAAGSSIAMNVELSDYALSGLLITNNMKLLLKDGITRVLLPNTRSGQALGSLRPDS